MKAKRIKGLLLSGMICLIMLFTVFSLLPFTATAETTTTDPLKYTKTANGYNVSLLDKTVEEVEIPSSYLGEKVTEIASSGFASAPNLKKVTIPETISKISNLAFNNCPQLKRVYFQTKKDNNNLIGIESIGQMSFAACPNLKTIILPSTISKANVNSLAFRNSPTEITYRGTETLTITGLLNGGSVTSDPFSVVMSVADQDDIDFVEDDFEDWGDGYAIIGYQAIYADELVIPHEFNGRPVLYICEEAFSNCEINSLSFSEEFSNQNQDVLLLSRAFANSKIKNITLISNVTYDGSTELFADSEFLETVHLPSNITTIVEKMFQGCLALRAISFDGIHNKIPATVTSIEHWAFANCISLKNLYIPATVPTQIMGAEIFSGWDYDFEQNIGQVIELGYAEEPEEWKNNNVNWLGGTPKVITASYIITYHLDGGENHLDNPAKYYNNNIVLKSPSKKGYDFLGWYDDNNFTNSVIEISEYEIGNKDFYAKWSNAIEYSITYILNGGTHTGNPAKYTVENSITLNDATRTGYTFLGWFEESDFSGNSIKNFGPSVVGAKTFYAKWSNAIEYNITYILNGGMHTGNPAKYTVENSITLNDATRTGYTFLGWFEESDFSGNNIKNFGAGVVGAKTFYAKWSSAIEYSITYILNGGTHTGNPAKYTVENSITLNDATRTGYTFLGWFEESDFSGNSIKNFGPSVVGVKTFYAKWSNAIEYSITYILNGGTHTGNPTKYTVENSITLNDATRTGYTFLGWFEESDFSGNTIKNFGPGVVGAKTFYAKWKANTYIVVLEGNTTIEVIFGSTMPTKDIYGNTLKAPTLTGYTFGGYYDGQNGSGIKYYNADMSSANIWGNIGGATLIAKWTANIYTITFYRSFAVDGSSSVKVTYNEPMPYAIAPTLKGNTFNGYFSESFGIGTKYYNADMSSANIWNKPNDAYLYASWSGIGYNITLDKQNGSGGSNSVIGFYEYSLPLNDILNNRATAPTRYGYTFEGYYEWQNGTGTKYYNHLMEGVNLWDKDYSTSIYAYWVPKTFLINFNTQGGMGGHVNTWVTFGEKMPTIVLPERVGYNFKGYFSGTNGSGSIYYYSEADAPYYNSIYYNLDYAVILYAYWTPKQYTLSLTHNGTLYRSLGYSYGQSIDLKQHLPTIALTDPNFGFIFNTFNVSDGTIYNINNGAIVNDITSTANIYGDATLKTTWYGKRYTSIGATFTPDNGVVVVDLRTLPAQNVNKSLYFDYTYRKITLIGSGNLLSGFQISFSNSDNYDAQHIIFANMNIKAPNGITPAEPSGKTCVTVSRRAIVEFIGVNTISGGDGIGTGHYQHSGSGGNAFTDELYANPNFSIIGSGELTLRGGNGGTTPFGQYESFLMYGIDGGRGGAGLFCYGTVTIGINKLYSFGGNGGDGSKPDTQGNYSPYAASGYGSNGIGYNGEKGLKGITGGMGGIGGDGVKAGAVNTLSTCIYIHFTGGSGGKGGTGGKGGKGQQGATGRDGAFLVTAQKGGNGGVGGDGGNGGNGGAGGIGMNSVLNAEKNCVYYVDGVKGAGGAYGAGGEGGDAGLGGLKWLSTTREASGDSGQQGANGKPGT